MIPGYDIIKEVSNNERYLLYHGRRQIDARPVLLKAPRRNPASAVDLAMLEREYDILQSLPIAGIMRPCALVRNQSSCALVLEDVDGIPLNALSVSKRVDLTSFFDIAIQLATILAELHRRDIIHQAISSCCVLVDPTAHQVLLTDFGGASTGASETRKQLPSYLFRAMLPYMSPEQTGRMNRVTDYRTDFYSLGVTLYELLTGRRPFESEDALELIHFHIAKQPTPPGAIDPAIPQVISDIVMKLLAKTAEERYQGALGLKHDLEVCARNWTAHGWITPFPLGQRDVSDRFLVPQKLYGREQEVECLLKVFDRTCEGPTALMLVAGYSGIGKTSLIQELYKPLVRQRGYFISGKFDQIARIPYGAFIQSFRGLVQQLLTESEDQLAGWRSRLSGALGTSGGVLAEVIPEIELILGAQAPPPPLGPAEAQNRFRLVFQNFVGALAMKEHPLVIFLDDLQWADSATLNLLEPLLTSPDIQFLFSSAPIVTTRWTPPIPWRGRLPISKRAVFRCGVCRSGRLRCRSSRCWSVTPCTGNSRTPSPSPAWSSRKPMAIRSSWSSS